MNSFEVMDDKSLKSDSRLLGVCLASVVGILVGVVFPPIMFLVFLLICYYCLSSKNVSNLFSFIIFLFPFAGIFKISATAMSFSTIIQLLLCSLFLLRERSISKKFLIGFVFVLGWGIFGLFNDPATVLKQITIPLLFYFFFSCRDRINRYQIAKFYVLSIIIVSVISLFKDYIPNLNEYIQFKTYRLNVFDIADTTRYSGFWGDPNYYSVNLILSLSLVLILQLKKKVSNITAVVFYAFLIFMGTLTASKSFLLMLAALIVFAIYSLWKNRKYLIVFAIIFSSALVIILIISGRITAFNVLLSRFDSSSVDLSSLTTGRTDLWLSYISYFNSKPYIWFLGNGLGANLINGMEAHNTYIQFIYNYGVLGLFAWIYCFYSSFRNEKKTNSVINLIPLIIVLMMYFFLSELMYFDFLYHMIIVCAFIVEDNSLEAIDCIKNINK